MDCLNLCEEARNLITDVQVDIGQGHWSTLNPLCVCVCVCVCVCCGCCCYGFSLRVILAFKTIFAMTFLRLFLMLPGEHWSPLSGKTHHALCWSWDVLANRSSVSLSISSLNWSHCFITSGIDPHAQGGLAGRQQVLCRFNNILSMLVSLIWFKKSLAYRSINSLESVHITHTQGSLGPTCPSFILYVLSHISRVWIFSLGDAGQGFVRLHPFKSPDPCFFGLWFKL